MSLSAFAVSIILCSATWTIVKEIDRIREKRGQNERKVFYGGGYNYAREKKLCSNWLGVKRPSEECGRREL